jgi:PAS domain S-box-containing protein
MNMSDTGDSHIGPDQAKGQSLERLQQSRLLKISQCFSTFGPDGPTNMNRLTALCGELLSASCALYNRLKNEILCSIGQWSTPSGYNSQDAPEGHLCYDVIRNNRDDALLVRDLQHTAYAQSDINVRTYGLQTYLGQVVRCAGEPVGSLCVVYGADYQPTEEDLQILTLLAAAVGNEEMRDQAEQHLVQTEEFQRTLLATIPDLVWLKNGEGVYLTCNHAFERLYGVTVAELVGKTDYDFVGRELAESFREHDRKATTTGQTVVNEEWLTFADNGYRGLFETTKTPMRDKAGRLIGVLGVARDITVRKESETVLAKQVEELSRWYKVTLGRENRIAELKHEVNALAARLGLAHPYTDAAAPTEPS